MAEFVGAVSLRPTGPRPILPPMDAANPATRRIVMAAYPGAEMLDVVGPLEVFSVASRILDARRGVPEEATNSSRPAYRVELVADSSGPLRMESGLEICATGTLRGVRGTIDTLIIPGGVGGRLLSSNGELLRWIVRMAPRARRVASVCTGAFLLGAAGLLRGRRATTHWRFCDSFAQMNPDVKVEPDAIFVRDGNVWTSAGVTAGMDLALALVEEDHGRQLALEVARMMVVFLKRPGGQSQFSAQLASQMAEREPLRDLQAWILEHPDADLRIEELARRAGMSPRNFARAFAREVGVTPARFVEQARLGVARRRLEDTAESVDEIATASGFGTTETMRRVFIRSLATNPSSYRARFRTQREHGNSHSAL